MLIITVAAVAWISLIALFVAVCRMAAHGDAVGSVTTTVKPGREIDAGLVLWEDPAEELTVEDRRSRSAQRKRRSWVTAHGAR